MVSRCPSCCRVSTCPMTVGDTSVNKNELGLCGDRHRPHRSITFRLLSSRSSLSARSFRSSHVSSSNGFLPGLWPPLLFLLLLLIFCCPTALFFFPSVEVVDSRAWSVELFPDFA